MSGAQQLLPGQPALLFAGLDATSGGSDATSGDGLRCAGGTVARLGIRVPDAGGLAPWGPGLGAIAVLASSLTPGPRRAPW